MFSFSAVFMLGGSWSTCELAIGNNGDDSRLSADKLAGKAEEERTSISTEDCYSLARNLCNTTEAFVYLLTDPSDGTIVCFHPAVFTSGLFVIAILQSATTERIPDSPDSVLVSFMKGQRKGNQIGTKRCYLETLASVSCTANKANKAPVKLHNHLMGESSERQNQLCAASLQPATGMTASLMTRHKRKRRKISTECYWESFAWELCTAFKACVYLVTYLSDGSMVSFHPTVPTVFSPGVLELPRSPWIKPTRSIHVRSLQQQIQRPYGLAGIDISSMPMLIGAGGAIMIPTAIQQLIHLERVIPIIDLKVNQNEEQPIQGTKVGEIILRYGTSWAWLASEVHDRYQAAQGGQQLQEVQDRLNPYNCWPSRSVYYIAIGRSTLFWPHNQWADVQVNLKSIVLRGGWIE